MAIKVSYWTQTLKNTCYIRRLFYETKLDLKFTKLSDTCDLSKTILYVKSTLHSCKCPHLFADSTGIKFAARCVLILLENQVIMCGLAVDRIVEVHRGHVSVHIVPVQDAYNLENINITMLKNTLVRLKTEGWVKPGSDKNFT